MDMETYEIWSVHKGIKTYEGKITGEAKVKEWIEWYMSENPGASVQYKKWQPPWDR